MENKHPEHLCVAYNSLSEIKKTFDFRNTLNHFIFQKFIPCSYDVVHYKHFYRDHNNLVIPKNKKMKFKEIFFSINITIIFSPPKILKIENKHPEHLCVA